MPIILSWPGALVAPNYGRPPGAPVPISNDHIYRDPDVTLPVRLLSYRFHGEEYISPPDRHWSLSWVVDNVNHRQLQVISERSDDTPQYMFWGGTTTKIGQTTNDARICIITPVGQLTLSQRQHLEELSLRVRVLVPNDGWNCQSWMMELFEHAIDAGLFTPESVNYACECANSE